jgi:hypothetical protein
MKGEGVAAAESDIKHGISLVLLFVDYYDVE